MIGAQLKLADVTVQFGERRVLDAVAYTFESDAVYVVRGRSGSGKTTLLTVLAGYTTPDRGSVVAQGRVGYLMQEELLFSELTVLDNLRIRSIGTEQSDQKILDRNILGALATVGIADLIDAPVAKLSGGERRRVELAGVLLDQPDFLLLDEPTANLDRTSAAAVYSALWAVEADWTVILVTHEPDIPFVPAVATFLELADGQLEERAG